MARFLFDCRQTAGFVTDPADATYLRVADVYPTTRNGITFGTEDTGSGESFSDVNRDNTYDPRIAGIIFTDTATRGRVRIDLPTAGDWDITLAIGGGFGTVDHYLELWDDTTVFATYDLHQSAPLRWFNAAGVEFDEHPTTGWPANNVPLLRTFTSTVFRLGFGNGVEKIGVLAHVGIEQVASPTGAGLIFRSRVIR